MPAPNPNSNPDRLVTADPLDDDVQYELKLRPHRLSEFIGQTKAKQQLHIALEAAKARGEALERLRPNLGSGLPAQQAILSAWHDLFLERKLSWGYDLDNPNWPFFHLHEGANGPTMAASPALVGQV